MGLIDPKHDNTKKLQPFSNQVPNAPSLATLGDVGVAALSEDLTAETFQCSRARNTHTKVARDASIRIRLESRMRFKTVIDEGGFTSPGTVYHGNAASFMRRCEPDGFSQNIARLRTLQETVEMGAKFPITGGCNMELPQFCDLLKGLKGSVTFQDSHLRSPTCRH